MAAKCGAETRDGGSCRRVPLSGKRRCHLHVGMVHKARSEGMRGHANAYKHGVYSDLIRPDEIPFVANVQARFGEIEDELLIARLQLRRALKAQALADDLPNAMEVCETIERNRTAKRAGSNEVKRKLRDYPRIINTLLGRIGSLEKTRAALQKGTQAASVSTGEFVFTVHRAKDET